MFVKPITAVSHIILVEKQQADFWKEKNSSAVVENCLMWVSVCLLTVFVVFLFWLVGKIRSCCRSSFTSDPSENFFLQPPLPDSDALSRIIPSELMKQSYDQRRLKDATYDAIYIGAGVSGLSGASLAAQHGKKVLVLDASDTLGGLCRTFEEDGFEFPSGCHWICYSNSIRNVWRKATGGRVQFDNISSSGFADTIHVIDSPNSYETHQIPVDPDEARASFLSTFTQDLDKDDELISQLNEYWDDVVKTEKERDFELLLKFMIPTFFRPLVAWILQLLLRLRVFRFREMTFQQYLQMRFPGSDPTHTKLRAMFSRWSHVAGRIDDIPASIALQAAGSTYKGKEYPIGGGNAIVEGLLVELTKHGGEAFCDAPVAEIILDDHDIAIGVRMENGDSIYAEVVVSCCGISNTYLQLLPPRVSPPKIEQYAQGGYHMAFAFLGFDCSFEELGLPDTDIWLIRNDANESLPSLYSSSSCHDYPQPLPLAYIGNPNRVHSPKENCCGLSVMIPTEPEHFSRWEGTNVKARGSEYRDTKEIALRSSIDLLFQIYPLMQDHLVHESFASNLSTKYWTNWPSGEVYGATANFARCFEMHDNCISSTGGVKGGLIVSGVDSMNAGGILAGLMSGMISTMQVTGESSLMTQLMSASSPGRKRWA